MAGIGGYGNCVGVPTVGGETNFDAGYDGNILVNAMCVGDRRRRQDLLLGRACAEPSGGLLRLQDPGATASTAPPWPSAEFDADSDEKRPTVQVGDPLRREAPDRGDAGADGHGRAVEAIQDMGAAGLTSSSVEMAGKGGVGIALDLRRRAPSAKPA